MTLNSRIQRDLRHQRYDKLVHWAIDSFELYRMGDIPYEEAVSDILNSLMEFTATGALALNLDEEKFLKCFTLIFKACKKREAAKSK